MKRLAALAALLALSLTQGCKDPTPAPYQGYVEGEFVYVASQLAGRLDELAVARGDAVRTGQRLFALESELERQGVEKAQANLKRAGNTLADLKKGLRTEEIDQILARIAQSRAELELARIEMQRRQRLLETGAVSREEYDKARTAFLTNQGRQADLTAQLATGKLGSRIDQILAASDQVEQAKAELAQANWALDQKNQAAVMEAQVTDIIHYRGEWVQAGSPVVKLLPPSGVKVRLFIPETDLGKVRLGQAATVTCDGCPAPFTGTVSFVNPQAEYTPPVIYSQDFRAKLVFMVEVRFPPQAAAALKPGQPVDVRLEAAR